MKHILTITILALFIAIPSAASADKMLYQAQIFSGYGSSVDGHNGISVGGKGLVFVHPNVRLGGLAYYENARTTSDHIGGVAFSLDYVAHLASRIDFIVGANVGMYSGTSGPAIYGEPGLGLVFNFGNIGIEWRVATRFPYYLGASQFHPERDIQMLTTVSMVFGDW